MIRIRDLRKRRSDGGVVREVLAGISLEVGRGEVVALLGPSGGGKTTLLRCINALERFDAGSIEVAGLELTPGDGEPRRDRQLRTRVGMVFQQYHLFPHLSAVENVALAPTQVQRVRRDEALGHARALLERVGLAHRMDAYPPSLSGGEQQRVAIARALATQPEVILFDEPTAALDPERRVSVLALLKGLAAEGQTLVVVTHEVEFAREVAHRAAVLDGGSIIESGPARTVLSAPSSQRVKDFLRAVGAAS